MEPSLLFQYGRVESPLYSSNMEEGRALSTLPIWKSREPSLLFLESAGSPVGGHPHLRGRLLTHRGHLGEVA